MKQFYTAQEIADALGVVRSTIVRRAEKQKWESQQRLDQGGGYEYHISNLPAEARKALEAQQINELLPRIHESKRLISKPASTLSADALNHRQRSTADARGTVINTINAMHDQGVSKEAAITTLLTQAETGLLAQINPVLDTALQMAKDPRGKSKSKYPSSRSIKRWFAKDIKTLAPKSKRDVVIPVWAAAFLKCWQRPEKPSIAHAYRQFEATYEDELPSIHSVRRFIEKMGNVSKQRGRMGAREIKNITAHYRRDTSDLTAGEVYSADGHTFDAEVQHPLHGRPFRPEVTTFIDVATRRVVGVSVDLAESSLAVLDALISSCTQSVPNILYVDNGGGYENALLKDEAVGVLSRLGVTMTHSIAYNSQARGIVERVHHTIWVDGAKSLPGYIGVDMDKEARLSNFKVSRKAVKQGGRMPLMGWADFMDWVNDRIDWYNARPHSSLPKITDEAGKRRHQTPDECWQQHIDSGWTPDVLTSTEAANIFRPRITRKVIRCEVKLMTNRYFNNDLTEWHGEEVQVAFDINDPQQVWVYELESGRLICEAQVDGNSQSYFPKSFRVLAAEKRAKSKLKRAEAKAEEARLELNGHPALEREEPMYIPNIGALTPELLNTQDSIEEAVVVESSKEQSLEEMTADQRIVLYQSYQNGKPVPEHHEFWVKNYGRSKEYSAWARRYEAEQEMGPEARTL